VWLAETGELVAFDESPRPSDSSFTGGGGGGGDGNFFVDLAVGAAVDAAIEGVVHHFSERTSDAGERAGDEVVVVGVETDGEKLRHALRGWERHMPEENGLAWVAARCDDGGAHDDVTEPFETGSGTWDDAAGWGRASDVRPGSDERS
jgi:hypothetical protein